MTDWHGIWNGRSLPEEGTLMTRLLLADGYDSPFAEMKEQAWSSYVGHVLDVLGAVPGQTVLDVGCGSGAMLLALAQRNYIGTGVDYSESLVEMARDHVPQSTVYHGEASEIDRLGRHDFVLSHSVFHYFPNLEYAEDVLLKMTGAAREAVAVLDVLDEELLERSLAERGAMLADGEYGRRYDGLQHLAFSREWFSGTATTLGWAIEIEQQSIDGYRNSEYRFNAFLRR